MSDRSGYVYLVESVNDKNCYCYQFRISKSFKKPGSFLKSSSPDEQTVIKCIYTNEKSECKKLLIQNYAENQTPLGKNWFDFSKDELEEVLKYMSALDEETLQAEFKPFLRLLFHNLSLTKWKNISQKLPFFLVLIPGVIFIGAVIVGAISPHSNYVPPSLESQKPLVNHSLSQDSEQIAEPTPLQTRQPSEDNQQFTEPLESRKLSQHNEQLTEPRIGCGVANDPTDPKGVNIRTGPSTDFDILKQVPNGTLFNIFEEKHYWFRVTYPNNGKPGWSSGKLVTKIPCPD